MLLCRRRPLFRLLDGEAFDSERTGPERWRRRIHPVSVISDPGRGLLAYPRMRFSASADKLNCMRIRYTAGCPCLTPAERKNAKRTYRADLEDRIAGCREIPLLDIGHGCCVTNAVKAITRSAFLRRDRFPPGVFYIPSDYLLVSPKRFETTR